MPNTFFPYIENEAFTCNPVNTNYRQTNESSSESAGSFFIATSENNRLSCVQGILTPKIKKILSGFSLNEVKEELYITAIDNLLKKVEFINLTMQLDQNLITEEEFDEELENNEDIYLIKINPNFKDIDLELVQSITQKLNNRKFSIDEISEMFSISIETIEEYVDSHQMNILF